MLKFPSHRVHVHPSLEQLCDQLLMPLGAGVVQCLMQVDVDRLQMLYMGGSEHNAMP